MIEFAAVSDTLPHKGGVPTVGEQHYATVPRMPYEIPARVVYSLLGQARDPGRLAPLVWLFEVRVARMAHQQRQRKPTDHSDTVWNNPSIFSGVCL
jgi:hypothetical protein